MVGVLHVVGPFVQTTGPLTTVGTVSIAALLFLIAGFVAVRATAVIGVNRTAELTPRQGALIGVLVVFLFVLIGGALVRMVNANVTQSLGVVAVNLGIPLVAAIASLGYERHRSVWVPASVFAAYLLFADVNLAFHLLG